MYDIVDIVSDQNTEALAKARKEWICNGAKPGHLIRYLRPHMAKRNRLHIRMYRLSE